MSKKAKSAGLRRRDDTPFRVRAVMLPALALALTLLVELGNRGLSALRVFRFILESPLIFLCNALIVLTTLVFSELFRRRRAVLGTVCILWLVLGFVQFSVVKNRTTPFSSMDLLLLKEAVSLVSIYCTPIQIILMFAGVFLVFALIIMLFARSGQRARRNLSRALVALVGCSLLCAMTAAINVRVGVFPQRFDSLVDDYNTYGFPVVFTYTFGHMGIERPKDYSDRAVEAVLEGIVDDGGAGERPAFAEDDTARPNLLFLQLESFIDVNTVRDCVLSRDPTPCFNRLRAQYPGGLLYVPTVGGGTANTEFEIITGLNLDYFGAGESPYSTILQQATCETVCFNLKPYGYVATALHNNGATFYNRNAIFPRLGFDCFVPVEYMQNVHYNDMGWAEDAPLTDEILNVLKGTEARDLILCITVESHGKYSDVYEPREGDIEVLSLPEGMQAAPLLNYVNAVTRTDAFLRQLIDALRTFDEPTVVVAYGDHLPALELSAENLTTGSIYATEYVIWNNYGRDFQAPDLQAYRLNAHILGQLGFSGGALTLLHQSTPPEAEDEAYLSQLELLEYDMLYGEQHTFEGASPYVATDMRLGSRDIRISGVDADFHRILVTGENFTEYSRIIADEQVLDTLFVDSGRVIARLQQDETPIGSRTAVQTIGQVAVGQFNSDGVELSRTAPFIDDSNPQKQE